jgi:hypothetical protein
MAEGIAGKRITALLEILAFSGANIVFAGPPKPGAEIPTHIALTGADFVMCALIYHKYYGEQISGAKVEEILGAIGLIVAMAAGGGYAIAKSASGLIAEFTNFLGPLGWMASSLLAAGGTALLGLIWLAIVDLAYRKDESLLEAAQT